MEKPMNLFGSIRCDAFRYRGRRGVVELVFLTLSSPGFLATACYRLSARMKERRYPGILYAPVRVVTLAICRSCGKELPSTCKIGPGLCLLHSGTVVIHSESEIGVNCTISHGVTIGHTLGGKHPGSPKIGNRVFIGPGAVILGGITVGDDAAIGANAVVTSDVAPMAVMVGVPAREISMDGASLYVKNLCPEVS